MSNVALVQEPQVQECHVTPQVRLTPQKEQAAVAEFDPHPLLTVLVAMAVAAVGALAFVGSIVAWLALRHSGVMAP
jgi:NAD/NADP transhydrogenase beta subunit